jgi:hypothetical protein
MDNNAVPVIVIGMHRSGTSMLTRFLQESGIFMGKEKGKNDEAFFFQEINDWILYQAGATWDNPYNMRFINDYFVRHISSAIHARLSSVWLKKYLGLARTIRYRSIDNLDIPWGWKDPRTTLTLPIWKTLFPEARLVHIYRNPVDVAASLRKREYDIENSYRHTFRKKQREWFLTKRPTYYQSSRAHNIHEGVKLWEEYLGLALAADQYYDSIMHIEYEEFLRKPGKILRQLSEFLSIDIDNALIASISSQADASRSFAFLGDPELVAVYSRVKENPLVSRLGYSNIMTRKSSP